MKLRRRGALALFLFLTLPLTACSVVDAIIPGDDSSSTSQDCTITKDQTFQADASYDEALRLHVETCRMDVDACPALCALVLSRQNIQATAPTCTARFDGDVATLQIKYSMPNPNNTCSFGDAGGPPNPPTPVR